MYITSVFDSVGLYMAIQSLLNYYSSRNINKYDINLYSQVKEFNTVNSINDSGKLAVFLTLIK